MVAGGKAGEERVDLRHQLLVVLLALVGLGGAATRVVEREDGKTRGFLRAVADGFGGDGVEERASSSEIAGRAKAPRTHELAGGAGVGKGLRVGRGERGGKRLGCAVRGHAHCV